MSLNSCFLWATGCMALPESAFSRLLNPFVELAFGEQYLFQRNIVLILCINFFINGIRKSVLIFKESMGLFWYDRYKALAEAVLNLSISIILVKNFGVCGVFAGTFCSTALTSVWVEPCILYKHRFHRPVKEYFQNYAECLLVMTAVWSLTDWICHFIRRRDLHSAFPAEPSLCGCAEPAALADFPADGEMGRDWPGF